MSILFVVAPKCRLATSHAAPWWITVNISTGLTDGRQTVALRFPLDVVMQRNKAACSRTRMRLQAASDPRTVKPRHNERNPAVSLCRGQCRVVDVSSTTGRQRPSRLYGACLIANGRPRCVGGDVSDQGRYGSAAVLWRVRTSAVVVRKYVTIRYDTINVRSKLTGWPA